jgi:hypothetical protein
MELDNSWAASTISQHHHQIQRFAIDIFVGYQQKENEYLQEYFDVNYYYSEYRRSIPVLIKDSRIRTPEKL